MGMQGEYKYNDPYHPGRYMFRSDHVSFMVRNIPVLFYSTGTHRDYHKTTDDVEYLDFEKFFKMTRFCFKVGYNIAGLEGEITVDYPYSRW